MPVFHTFMAGGKKYMYDANVNAFIVLSDTLYADLERYKKVIIQKPHQQ